MIDQRKRLAEAAIDFCEKPGAKEYPEVAEAHIKGLAMIVLCSAHPPYSKTKRPYAKNPETENEANGMNNHCALRDEVLRLMDVIESLGGNDRPKEFNDAIAEVKTYLDGEAQGHDQVAMSEEGYRRPDGYRG